MVKVETEFTEAVAMRCDGCARMGIPSHIVIDGFSMGDFKNAFTDEVNLYSIGTRKSKPGAKN